MGIFVFDVVIITMIVVYTIYGWHRGFLFSIFTVVGLVGGAIAAIAVVPTVGSAIHDDLLRVPVVLGCTIGLAVAGHALGSFAGDILEARVKRHGTRIVDEALGALLNAIVSVVVIGLLTSSIGTYAIPGLTGTIAQSTTLRVIKGLQPDPVQRLFGEVQNAIVRTGIPSIQDALSGISRPVSPHPVVIDSPELRTAAHSVVRVTAPGVACNQVEFGSGFVISKDHVLTNAHVVAGADHPVITLDDGRSLTGSVVYFDSDTDLAVIGVTGLDRTALQLGGSADVGLNAVINGFPYGGEFNSRAARVIASRTAELPDIYGTSVETREVYTLEALVQEGDSGGPLIDASGYVRGIVFARAANDNSLGYAMTNAEMVSVVNAAPRLKSPVTSGPCVQNAEPR